MPIPEQRDLEKARVVIRDWLAAKLPDARDLSISPLIGPAFTGFSNETLIFDADWTEGGERRSAGYVIRVKPTAHTIFLEADFDSQYKVIKALSEHTDVPLPPVHWYEDDESVLGAPFFVMGKVEGHVPSDNPPYTQTGWLLDEAKPAVRRRVVENGLEALARIHRTDWRALGLDFLD
jgi:aminoglycoside phosphotransferase (APT) family kinase protein